MSEAIQSPAQETPKADQGAAAPQTPNAGAPGQSAGAQGQKPAADAPKADAPAQGKKADAPAPAAAAEKPGEDQASQKTPNEKTETPKDEKAAPEKYDLKLPEGSLLKPEALEKVSQYAKEQKLSNEQAQALLNRENEAVASFAKDFDEKVKQEVTGWINEAKSDKEIAGAEFEKSVHLANQVIQKFGSEAFVKKLNETGLGNHPELVRVFARIGKLMDDDKLILTGKGDSAKGKMSHAEVLYGNSSKK